VARAHITARDRLVLEFLAEHRVAVAPQIQALLGVSARAAQARLRALSAHGYVELERIFEGRPATCRITRQGLGAIGSRLRPGRLDLAYYAHDLGLGWLWLAAQGGAFGRVSEITSERHMRSYDARADRDGEPFGVGLGGVGPRGGRALHYPDLLLRTGDGRRVAVELELTGKGRRRLERIMQGYAIDRRIDAVLYLVPNPALGARIEQAARAVGIADRVHVQLVAGVPHGAPDPGRSPARRATRGGTRAEPEFGPALPAQRGGRRAAGQGADREAAR
jgi:hypothetical protein